MRDGREPFVSCEYRPERVYTSAWGLDPRRVW
jgi:hypothetical protein